MLAKTLLEDMELDVLVADTVPRAIELLEQQRVDAILTDIRVPGGGESLLVWVRQQPRISQLPVIALTAHAMLSDRDRFLGLGFNGYVSKPIDTMELENLVTSVLSALSEGAE
jgi:CheY-like chemotaxis protein